MSEFINLDKQKNRIIYGRIIALNFMEQPVKTLEGVITGGSINIDGASAVRRTCSLSMVTNDVDINNYMWALNTKFKLEIGIENATTKEIVWFKQGLYIITSFASILSTSGYTINLSGKDKMGLLNGENGGILSFEVDFGKYEEVDSEGNLKYISYPIKDIIREAVHHYGGEPFHNIVITDLDDIAAELLEYKYDTPLYLIRRSDNTNTYFQGTLQQDYPVYVNNQATEISKLDAYDSLIDSLGPTQVKPTIFTFSTDTNATEYCAAKITYGQAAGYRQTELTYAGDLIAKAGESITSVLDKIKNMLGNYEYFYDLDGRFIFQAQKNFINTSWSPIINTNNEFFIDPNAEKILYNFNGNELISAFNNNPNISNAKNDYSVWGSRKSASDGNIPIHMRYAIDEKPIQYNTIQVNDDELIDYNKKYGFALTGQNSVQYLASEDINLPLQEWDDDTGKIIMQESSSISIEATGNTKSNRIKYKMTLDSRDTYVIAYFIKNTQNINTQLLYPVLYFLDSDGSSITTVISDIPLTNNFQYVQYTCTIPQETSYVAIGSVTNGAIDNQARGNTIEISSPTIRKKNGCYDWRELIYQMALDYRKYGHLDDFEQKVAAANPQYPTGKTGYEQYYIDIEGFWRQLYNPQGFEEYDEVTVSRKEDIENYYTKQEAFKEVTDLNGVQNGTQLYTKKADHVYVPTYRPRPRPDSDDDAIKYYTKEITYIPAIPKDESNVKQNIYIKDTINGQQNKYSYIVNTERDVICVLSDEVSDPATIGVTPGGPIVVNQPQYNCAYATDLPVSVICDFSGNDLTYEWWYKNADSTTWVKSTNMTDNRYYLDYLVNPTDPTDDSRKNRLVYCKAIDKHGNAVSTNLVTITNDTENISQQEWSLGTTELSFSATKNDGQDTAVSNGHLTGGEKITLSTDITSEETLYYNWYEKKENSNTYILLVQTIGDATYTIGSASKVDLDGTSIFCIVQDESGRTIATQDIIIQFRPNLKITQQPTSVIAEPDPQNSLAEVTVSTNITDDNLTYQWLYMNRDKDYYLVSTDNTGNSYSMPLEDDGTNKRHGRRLICRITDNITNQTVYTDPAVIFNKQQIYPTLQDMPTTDMLQYGNDIVTQGDIHLGVSLNDQSYTIKSYDWYYANPGSNTFQKTTTFTGATYQATMNEECSGRRLYCIMTIQLADGTYEFIQTPTITIRLPKELVLLPLDNQAGADKIFICRIKQHEGDTLTYNWYVNDTIVEQNNSSTYSYTDNTAAKIYCEVTDSYGQKATTNIATYRPNIKNNPQNQATVAGVLATLEVVGEGANDAVWYYNPYNPNTQYYMPTTRFKEAREGWSEQVYEAPETLNFWFDFLDVTGDLAKISVKAIGPRQKVVNDQDVKSIYYRDIPEIYYNSEEQTNHLNIPDQYQNMFTISARGKSAKDAIDNLLYNHAHCIESVTLTSVPIYYLEPNHRILISDENSGISGEYIISKFTIPLTYNGMMSISATKAINRLL